ncbi:MAG: zf-HC2 domain-containing protein [Acidobacteria bacterium]|nr:zf-HC2 domain-containing protein [Acidobacteriota bacterium]MCI0720868.1 zf-HC2 domain-containing protein [Acidobacteriota bacterium]
MISHRYKELFRNTWHPSQSNLVEYLGGELPAKTAAKLRTHLEGCWSCRIKREKIERTISTFMEYRMEVLPPPSAPAPQARKRFENKLSRILLESEKPPLLGRWMGLWTRRVFLPHVSVRLVAGLLAACLMLFFFIRLSSVPPVSAKELLQRAENAEAQRIRQVAAPVVYQKLQVRRHSSTLEREAVVTWEIWNDASNNRFRERVEDVNGSRFISPQKGNNDPLPNLHSPVPFLPPILAELEQIFETNHMDGRRPLSPSAYEGWRRSIQYASEEVIETRLPEGDKALTLKTAATGPFSLNAIVEAELVIRSEDWHPVEQRVQVQGKTGVRSYELAETAYQVVALNTLPPSIFADLTPPSANTIPTLTTVPRIPMVQTEPPPSAAELLAAEIQVRYALHRLKACLGEPVELVRDPGGWIEVRGLAKSPERKEELLAELSAVPRIKVNLQTMEEAAREVLSQSQTPVQAEKELEAAPPAENPLGNVAEVQTGRFPLQDHLAGYFIGQLAAPSPAHLHENITELSNRAFSFSQSALAEAWALRRLAEWYPPQKTGRLPQSTQWLLEAMVQDHVSELSLKISRSRDLLEPVLSSIRNAGETTATDPEDPGVAGPSETADGSWPEFCLQLFHSIEQADRLTLGLFTGTGLPAEQGQKAVESLIALLARLGSQVGDLEREIAKEFSVNPNLLSRKSHAH